MPMFYTPKPRKFHYDPRFYDPEKEKWEALKEKYQSQHQSADPQTDSNSGATDADLEYFESKVRSLSQSKKQKKLGVMDLFRKREMPKFNYQPRYNSDGTLKPVEEQQVEPKHKVKIRRRFDIEDEDYLKPVPAGKIMLYALAAFLILYFILF